MSLSKTEIAKIAHLARLSVSDTEISAFSNKLTSVLTMIEQIQAMDTAHITPMAHPFPDLVQRLRKDEVTEPDVHEKMQALAPSAEAGLYLVPAVLEPSS